jgi:hypothetical protein
MCAERLRVLSTSIALLVLMMSPDASADGLSSSRYDLTEKAHEIVVVVDRGFATLTVRRTVANTGPRSDEALFWIDVPTSAVATRLRTSGVDTAGKTVWFEGDLMDAEEAASKYHELTGIGGYYPKDPALLSWRDQGALALQVFPVLSRASKTVEYTLEMPMRYEDGAYRMEIPPLGTRERPATVRALPAHADDRLRVNGVLAAGARVESVQNIAFELDPAPGRSITGALAEVPLATDRVLFHGRIDASAKLSEIPAQAAIAIVLDTSKSMEGRVALAVTAARAYLSNFPSAEVTLVTFDRRVATPLGTALSIPEALARIQGFAPQPQNGSQVDEAIVRADRVLAASAAGARRMLVLTDLLTRAALTPDKLAALPLKSGATVHVATIEHGETSTLTRDDDDAWAGLPRKTGGVLWHAETSEAARTARRVFEEWARPTRIDRLRVYGFPGDFAPPDVLAEGSGVECLALADKLTERISIEGELWSSPLKFAVTSSPAEERRWSALVFGSSILGEFTEPEQRQLAMRGRAVSPMTSYLAVEPGVRPSIEGLEDENESAGEGGGGSGSGIGLGGSFGGLGRGRPLPEPQAFLDRELERAWARCGGRGGAHVDLESTKAEVVEIGAVTLSNPDPKAASCMREATWALDLPRSFAQAHANWSVDVGG